MKHPENLTTLFLVLIVVLFMLLLLTLIPLYWIGVTYLTVWTAYGFGYSLPWWPTFGAVVLVHLVLGVIGNAFRSK